VHRGIRTDQALFPLGIEAGIKKNTFLKMLIKNVFKREKKVGVVRRVKKESV
jgi:hypothetical protein